MTRERIAEAQRLSRVARGASPRRQLAPPPWHPATPSYQTLSTRELMMRSHLPKLLLIGVLIGCNNSTGPVMCTRELRYGIEMLVVDADSGVPSASGATMTLREGTYVESTIGREDGSLLVGAPERAGTYTVTVARSGFHTWVQTDVVVTADECHVQTVSLRAQLESI